MNTLVVNGSPHWDGNTSFLTAEAKLTMDRFAENTVPSLARAFTGDAVDGRGI